MEYALNYPIIFGYLCEIEEEYKKVVNRIDITNEWINHTIKNNNPQILKFLNGDIFKYKGEKYLVDDKKVKYCFNLKEMKFIEWILNKTKIDIQLNPKINKPEGVSTADIMINNEYYDLKIVSGKSRQLIYHNIYSKEKQSHNFLFEATESPLDFEELINQANIIYSRTDVFWVNMIGIKKDSNFIIFKRKNEGVTLDEKSSRLRLH